MPLSRRALLASSAALALLPLFAGGCRPGRAPLVVASNTWLGYELMFLARDEGWFSSSEVVLRHTASVPESVAALRAGDVVAAALTLDEVLREREQGLPLSIVLIFNISNGADVVLARPPVSTLADLRGRRLAVEDSALGAVMLHKMLEAGGLAREELSLLRVGIDAHIDAWARPDIDAIITYAPVSSMIEAQGAVRLFDSRDVPDTVFDVLAVRTDLLAGHEAALEKLVAAYFRALRHLRHNPQDASYRMAARIGLTGPEVLDAYRMLELPDLALNRAYLGNGPSAARFRESVGRVADILLAEGLLQSAPDAAGLVTSRYLPESDQ